MATGKKPSAAQLRARANFIKMVKERARLRAAGKLPPTTRKAKAAKVKRKVGKPSPAQLAARAKFVAMVRAKAANKGKKVNARKHGPLSATAKYAAGRAKATRRTDRKESKAWLRAGKRAQLKMNSRGFSTAPPSWIKGTKKKAIQKRKNVTAKTIAGDRYTVEHRPGEKNYYITVKQKGQRKSQTVSAFRSAARARQQIRLYKSRVRKRNPGIVKMSEAEFAKFGSKIKGIGNAPKATRARTISSAPRKKAGRKFKKVGIFGGSGFLGLGKSIQTIKRNPSLMAKIRKLIAGSGKRKPAKVGTRRTQRGRHTAAPIGYRRTQRGKRNPAPASVFSEFRGKSVTRKTQMKAATGTPSTLAQLGKLRELKLRGKVLKFRAGHLAADGRKKLHIVGIKAKQRGNPGGETDYGEIISVTYEADKPVVEPGVFNYVHRFGEEGGTRPHLIVDPEGYMKIEGGSYGITADGIIN